MTAPDFGVTEPSFDHPVGDAYTQGDTVTMTVNYTSRDVTAGAAATQTYNYPSVTITDVLGEATISSFGADYFTVNVPATETAPDPVISIEVSDTGNHVWTLVSNTMESFDSSSGIASWTAVFTTTA
jgi:hypothetical protein